MDGRRARPPPGASITRQSMRLLPGWFRRSGWVPIRSSASLGRRAANRSQRGRYRRKTFSGCLMPLVSGRWPPPNGIVGGRTGQHTQKAAPCRPAGRVARALQPDRQGACPALQNRDLHRPGKGELGELRVKHLDLDRTPYGCIELPGEFTKNGEDARLLLVPALTGELRAMSRERGQTHLSSTYPSEWSRS